MAEPYSRIESLSLSSNIAGRTRFYSEADRAIIGTVSKGVLFVMAFWSGPSRLAFKALQRVLETTDPTGQLELVVVDTDGCPDLYELPEFRGKLNGAGEAAWIRNGQIICTSGSGYHPELFDPYTRRLLEEAQD